MIVDNAFVPAHRVLRFSDALGSTAPGAKSNKNPLYRISLLTGVAFALAMPAVGAASGSLERFIDENKVRQTHGAVVLGGKKIADFQTIQKRVGEAAARIDACRLVARHAVEAAELQVRHDGRSSMTIRLLGRRTQSFIANEAKTAIDLIFDAAGGRCCNMAIHCSALGATWPRSTTISVSISTPLCRCTVSSSSGCRSKDNTECATERLVRADVVIEQASGCRSWHQADLPSLYGQVCCRGASGPALNARIYVRVPSKADIIVPAGTQLR